MSERPLPCPFCGQQPTVQEGNWVACENCISKHIICSAPNVEAWNTRATNAWKTRNEWEASGRTGAIWVVYKGDVKPSYYSAGEYWFNRNSRKRYLPEGITHIMQRQKQPVPPKRGWEAASQTKMTL